MDEKLAMDGGKPVREKRLPAVYPGAAYYGEEEKASVADVLDRKSPFRFYGPDIAGKVRGFEALLAEKTGRKFALGVSSCTASLVTALKGLGVGPGDKVVLPAVTFTATAGACVCAGAVPVFADVDDSLN